eukprot:179073-Hanusia_phi.AAC.1
MVACWFLRRRRRPSSSPSSPLPPPCLDSHSQHELTTSEDQWNPSVSPAVAADGADPSSPRSTSTCTSSSADSKAQANRCRHEMFSRQLLAIGLEPLSRSVLDSDLQLADIKTILNALKLPKDYKAWQATRERGALDSSRNSGIRSRTSDTSEDVNGESVVLFLSKVDKISPVEVETTYAATEHPGSMTPDVDYNFDFGKVTMCISQTDEVAGRELSQCSVQDFGQLDNWTMREERSRAESKHAKVSKSSVLDSPQDKKSEAVNALEQDRILFQLFVQQKQTADLKCELDEAKQELIFLKAQLLASDKRRDEPVKRRAQEARTVNTWDKYPERIFGVTLHASDSEASAGDSPLPPCHFPDDVQAVGDSEFSPTRRSKELSSSPRSRSRELESQQQTDTLALEASATPPLTETSCFTPEPSPRALAADGEDEEAGYEYTPKLSPDVTEADEGALLIDFIHTIRTSQ